MVLLEGCQVRAKGSLSCLGNVLPVLHLIILILTVCAEASQRTSRSSVARPVGCTDVPVEVGRDAWPGKQSRAVSALKEKEDQPKMDVRHETGYSWHLVLGRRVLIWGPMMDDDLRRPGP